MNKSVIYRLKLLTCGRTSSGDRSANRGTTRFGITSEWPGKIGFKFTNAAQSFVV